MLAGLLACLPACLRACLVGFLGWHFCRSTIESSKGRVLRILNVAKRMPQRLTVREQALWQLSVGFDMCLTSCGWPFKVICVHSMLHICEDERLD